MRVYFKTFGCRVNQYETAAVAASAIVLYELGRL